MRERVCMGFVALIPALVLCARSQDSLMSVSVRRVYVLFLSVGFKNGGKLCPKTRETTALQRGIQKASRTLKLAVGVRNVTANAMLAEKLGWLSIIANIRDCSNDTLGTVYSRHFQTWFDGSRTHFPTGVIRRWRRFRSASRLSCYALVSCSLVYLVNEKTRDSTNLLTVQIKVRLDFWSQKYECIEIGLAFHGCTILSRF